MNSTSKLNGFYPNKSHENQLVWRSLIALRSKTLKQGFIYKKNFVFFSTKIFDVKRSHQIMYMSPKQNIENLKKEEIGF